MLQIQTSGARIDDMISFGYNSNYLGIKYYDFLSLRE